MKTIDIPSHEAGSDATLRARIGALEAALEQFAECNLNDDNCASLEVASKRIQNIAKAALATAKVPEYCTTHGTYHVIQAMNGCQRMREP